MSPEKFVNLLSNDAALSFIDWLDKESVRLSNDNVALLYQIKPGVEAPEGSFDPNCPSGVRYVSRDWMGVIAKFVIFATS